MSTPTTPLTRKDFLSSVDPRWCPGCGCYAVLQKITSVMPTLGIPRENFAVISGIGCSSRFPYYTNTYGFHTIHGRAPTVATGLKLANPDLSVWVITGDGDGLSIGGNHFIHLMRRNVDLKIILFNNQIYGLTKGQASPTTLPGTKTKTTPTGVFDRQMAPMAMAIAAGATFAARAHDSDGELLTEVMTAAAAHKGIAFVEVMLNCVIFNDAAMDPMTNKATRSENSIRLRHGQPIVFGADNNKGIRLNNMTPEIANVSEAKDILRHDIHAEDTSLAFSLAQFAHPKMPTPFGIFRQVTGPVYEDNFKSTGEADLDKLFKSGTSWVEKG
ncbi:MAG: 2-oxoacid:ferredoxin oxidoreductase subunit beta [Bdellovibrionales bacterium GWC1_52_8]|nr:MAG: 2-oxoacid:ferredoxin oxidoreductase subunit beta [Bdellovibrionales bacterium GWB1_52_6]OFZ05820.1 MAG: 2-oxoacid:ferredoxin oxidoreductase subunit beta [Bdellovibrionales bacterium GWA1_52_35]OFZ39329.1 MAG: 2-oxoacid:ferredoxin oxidoreductase subunit beta [Bdellovibrionales bacterium GWC1_52_8]HCM40235.1 2-oxoacid:ferredoxin oxidoreductase subunit beta [Bdellovibrionales bacterium]